MNKCSTGEEQALKTSTNAHSKNFRGTCRGRGKGKGDRGNRDFSRDLKTNDDKFQGKEEDKDKILTNLR